MRIAAGAACAHLAQGPLPLGRAVRPSRGRGPGRWLALAAWPLAAAGLVGAARADAPAPPPGPAPAKTRCYVYMVRPTDEIIKPDGELTTKEWNGAIPAASFTLDGTDQFIRSQTLIRLSYDFEALYLGVVCYEEQMDKVAGVAADGDKRLLDDDCLVWDLSPGDDAKQTLRFAVSAAGAKLALKSDGSPWAGAWTVGVKKTTTSWSVEAKIPFESLGRETPGALEMWRVQVLRRRRGDQKSVQESCWAPVAEAGQPPTQHGRLVFLQQPLPPGTSPLDGLTTKAGGPVRAFADAGYVDVDDHPTGHEYAALLAGLMEAHADTAQQLAEMKAIVEKQPDHPLALEYAKRARQWEGLGRDVRALGRTNALAWCWGALDIADAAQLISELHDRMKKKP